MQFFLKGDDTDFGISSTNEVKCVMVALAEFRQGNENIRLVNENGLHRMWIKYPGNIEEEDNYLIATYKKCRGDYVLSEEKRNYLLNTLEGMSELLSMREIGSRYIVISLDVLKWAALEVDDGESPFYGTRRLGQQELYTDFKNRLFSTNLINPRIILELEAELHLLKYEVKKLHLERRGPNLDRKIDPFAEPAAIDNTGLSNRLYAILSPLVGMNLLFARTVLEHYGFTLYTAGQTMSHNLILQEGSVIGSPGDSTFYLPLE